MVRLLAALALLTASGTALAQTPRLTSPLFVIEHVEDRLEFCGLYYGQPISEAEAILGDLFPQTPPQQGWVMLEAQTEACGYPVALEAQGPEDDEPTLRLIYIMRRAENPEEAWTLGFLRGAAKARFPLVYYEGIHEAGVTEWEDTTPQYHLEGVPGQVIVLKPGESVFLGPGD